jgi:hypothetical protein
LLGIVVGLLCHSCWRAASKQSSVYGILDIGSPSYLDEFWGELVASQNVDCFEIKFDTQSFGQ